MIYLDSCLLIYATELESDLGLQTRGRLSQATTDDIIISPLVEMECLIKPLRDGNYSLLDAYRRTFAQYRSFEPDRGVYHRAAELRAGFGLKSVDAIHLAMAQLAGCTELWTNDDRLAKASGGLAVNILRAL